MGREGELDTNETPTRSKPVEQNNPEQLRRRRYACTHIDEASDALALAVDELRAAGLPTMANLVDGHRLDLVRWEELLRPDSDQLSIIRKAEQSEAEATAVKHIKEQLESYCRCPGSTCPVHGDVPGVPT